jgi:F0F1-type ATP synthase membrane subunit c/vacuolar-type H+-ATPase subunit K
MTRIPSRTLQQQFKTTNYIGLAMMASVFLYAVLVMGIDKGYLPYKVSHQIDSSILDKVKYILLAISILHYIIIRFFQKFSLKSAAYLPAASILTFALCEVIAIYGLVLFLLSGISMDFYIFMLISLFYFYIFYPKYTDWEKLLVQEYSKKQPT